MRFFVRAGTGNYETRQISRSMCNYHAVAGILRVTLIIVIAHALPREGDTLEQQVHSIGNCCGDANLFECVYGMKRHNESSVLIVTSKASDILGSEGYGLAVNSAYATYAQYAFRILPAHRPDGRWDIVRSLSNMLLLNDGIKYKYEVIVWLDPNVVVVDMSMSIIALLERHNSKDIILSAAKDIYSDRFLIIRNSDWSRDFMQRWVAHDHDQYTPEASLGSLLTADLSHATLLPPQTLTSSHRTSKEFNVNSSVVDMANEDIIFRYLSFHAAWSALCSHLSVLAAKSNSEKPDDAHTGESTCQELSSGSAMLVPPRAPLGLSSQELQAIRLRVPETKRTVLATLLADAKTAMLQVLRTRQCHLPVRHLCSFVCRCICRFLCVSNMFETSVLLYAQPSWSNFWAPEDLLEKIMDILQVRVVL